MSHDNNRNQDVNDASGCAEDQDGACGWDASQDDSQSDCCDCCCCCC